MKQCLLLGISTDTQDISGTVLKEQETADLDESQVEEAILSFRGSYDQIPPMYSALKVNGKKLYELAREGKTVERKPRRVTISEIEILSMELPRARIRVECSKGTYIRTLCQDIGEKLGVGGCMEELIRIQSGTVPAGRCQDVTGNSGTFRSGKIAGDSDSGGSDVFTVSGSSSERKRSCSGL